MTEAAEGFSGRCLCGAVTFKSIAGPQAVVHCCCVDCRKSSGTGHCTHIVIPKNGFDVTGDVTRFSHPGGSGNTVTKAFCGTCGSPVYSMNSGYPETVFPRASILDDPERVQPQMVVFAKSAISWDRLDEALPAFDEGPS